MRWWLDPSDTLHTFTHLPLQFITQLISFGGTLPSISWTPRRRPPWPTRSPNSELPTTRCWRPPLGWRPTRRGRCGPKRCCSWPRPLPRSGAPNRALPPLLLCIFGPCQNDAAGTPFSPGQSFFGIAIAFSKKFIHRFQSRVFLLVALSGSKHHQGMQIVWDIPTGREEPEHSEIFQNIWNQSSRQASALSKDSARGET